MGLGILAPHKIEDNRGASAKVNAPLVAYIHDLQDAAHTHRWLLRRRLLRLLDELGHPLGFFLLIVIAQGLAVLLHCAPNDVAVDEKDLRLLRLGLLYSPIVTDILPRFHRSIGKIGR